MTDTNTLEPGVQAEIYGTEPDDSVKAKLQLEFDAAMKLISKRTELAQEIGLPRIAEQDKNRVKSQAAIDWCKARGLLPLTSEDRATWEAWLPTGYATGDGWMSIQGGNKWDLYRYADGVPMHIRKLIKEAMSLFTFVEIRTPERQPRAQFDPGLFGHVVHPDGQQDVALLARWGESDANLITFDEIKEILDVRRHLNRLIPPEGNLPGALILGSMTAFVVGSLLSLFGLIPIMAAVGAEFGFAYGMFAMFAPMLAWWALILVDRIRVYLRRRGLIKKYLAEGREDLAEVV